MMKYRDFSALEILCLLVGLTLVAAGCETSGGQPEATHTQRVSPQTQTSALSPGTQSAPRVTATQVPDSSVTFLTVDQLWQRKDEFLDQQVGVKGTADFVVDCAAVEDAGPENCATTADLFLKGSNTSFIYLFEEGEFVSCVRPADEFDWNCSGWVRAKEYQVVGILRQEEFRGRPSDLFLEILSKEPQ